MERLLNVPPGKPFVWLCLECWNGAVFPRKYTSIHGNFQDLSPEEVTEILDVFEIP
jgi:hypothetical protein